MYSDEFSSLGEDPATVSVWDIVELGTITYINPAFELPLPPVEAGGSKDKNGGRASSLPPMISLYPSCDLSQLSLWRQLYFRDSFKCTHGQGLLTRESALETKLIELQRKVDKMVPESVVEDALDLIEYVSISWLS